MGMRAGSDGGSWRGGARGRGVAALAAAMAILLAPPAVAGTLVFAAASTGGVLTELAGVYQTRGGETVVLSFAASSALARHIEHGAPAAIYLSANTAWMDYLDARGLIEPASRARLMGNRLALIAPADSPAAGPVGRALPLAVLIGDGRLALGDPDHVPAGIYAREALKGLGLWSAVEGRLARMSNVRLALVMVERGEAALGVVYESDAAASARVKLIGLFPAESHPPIVYWVALVAGRADAAARRFLAFLRGAEAAQVFSRHGFLTDRD